MGRSWWHQQQLIIISDPLERVKQALLTTLSQNTSIITLKRLSNTIEIRREISKHLSLALIRDITAHDIERHLIKRL